ncbi:MAG: monofunctional biosynthetic peptidoglycan transglycosylase [Firmicutes bacterium]|nr:monofunctional biosynthetic peptidoglycan transglycosylase [Bacillota bacterium]
MKRTVLSWCLVYVPAILLVASLLMVLAMKWGPVSRTPLMVTQRIANFGNKSMTVKYEWMPLDRISDAMIRTVIVAEDSRFFNHAGFDFQEMRLMKKQHLYDGSPIRGCSTISQQTAKNCFTLGSKTWLRKGVEAWFTVLIERIWGKRRILEVYLNVAEMGPGIYGAEAAAQRYFHIPASALTIADASSIACCLPNPRHRYPDWANRSMAGRRAQIAEEASRTAVKHL